MFEEINRHRFLSTEAMTSNRIIRLSLVGMILASFVGVGTFHAQSSFAFNRRPSARAKTRSGDARNAGKVTEDKAGHHHDLLAEFPYLGPPHNG